jgi:hypothetical protein
MAKRIPFDLNRALQLAWDLRWEGNMERRKEDAAYEKKVGKKPFDWAKTYYLTASDIERAVRDIAEMLLAGKPWPKKHSELEYGYGGSMAVRVQGGLHNAARRWLLRHPKLTSHNFGRGHISGQRFRPVGEPLAEAEKETMAAHAKRRDPNYVKPRHLRIESGWRTLCLYARNEGKPRRYWGNGRSQARTVTKREEVTCKQCLNLLASKYKFPAKKAVE